MAAALQQLRTGLYLFFGTPSAHEGQNTMVTGFSATAIHISKDEADSKVSVEEYHIHSLLAKTSDHMLGEKSIEAHKLYTWPANLGDPKAWAYSKQSFFEQHLMNQAIEILNVGAAAQITWKFIPLAKFKSTAIEAQAVTILSDIFPEI
ncbi:hypothetical protein [Pedobacter gandavensis]|uniref:hypothetical protein n=1 Tax=Pedobacter gandavensis TaxID=2679963 RepID=UPI00292FCCCB|nr:hypothetical protein [Pedobacter gandavensis]